MIFKSKKINRFLSLLLAVLMITSTFTFNANATEASLIETNSTEPDLVVEPGAETAGVTTESAIGLIEEVTQPTDLERISLVSNVQSGVGNSINITTANMFQIDNCYGETRAVFEVSDLDFTNNSYCAVVEVNGGAPYNCYINDESETIGYFNVDFATYTEGIQEIKISVVDNSHEPTLTYEPVLFNIYLTSSFAVDNVNEIVNTSKIVSVSDLNTYVRFYLPINYDTNDIRLKLVDDYGEVYALENPSQGINTYDDNIHDIRYKDIYTISDYNINIEVKCISNSLYCGQPLVPGNYNVEVYDINDNHLYTVYDVLEVTSLPVVSINGHASEFPELYEGTDEIYCQVNIEGGSFEDFEVQLYDDYNNLVAESNGIYYPENLYNETANVIYKLELVSGMSISSGDYTFKLISDVPCVYEGDDSVYVSESIMQVYKAVPTNYKYANIVLFGIGFDPNYQYKAVLINETDEIIAEKLVMSDNNIFEIEFTDQYGKVIELQNSTSYRVSINSRNYNGEWEDYGPSASFHNYYYGDISMLGVDDYDGDAYFDSMNLKGYIYLSDNVVGNYPNPDNFKIVAVNILGQEYVYDNFTIDTEEYNGETRYFFEQPGLATMPFGNYKTKLYYGDEEVLVDGINLYEDKYYDQYTNAPSIGQFVNGYNNVDFIGGFFFENITEINNPQLKLYDIFSTSIYPDHTIDLTKDSYGNSFIYNDNFVGVDIYKKYNGVIYLNGKALGTCEEGYFAPDDLVVDENVYSITVNQGETGLLTPSVTSGTIGKLVYIFNDPAEGYQLKPNSVKVNGQPIMGRCFMLSGDAVVTAEFEPVQVTKYSIGVSNIYNGSLTVDKTQATEGELVTITANPNENYNLSKLRYRSVVTSEYTDIDLTTNTFIMPAYDIEIYAEFSFINSYYIRFIANDYGRIVVADSYVKEGSVVNITPEPKSGCRLVEGSVYYKINDAGEPIHIENNSFIMPSATIYIYAEFESIYTYNIIMSDMANGSVQINQTTAAAGDKVSINIIPSPGYMLKEDTLMVNGSIIPVSSYETSFIMPYENAVLTCEFQLIPDTNFNISIDEYISNGTVTVNIDTASVRGGDLVYVTTTPNFADYKLTSLYYEYNNQSVDIVDNKFNMPLGDVKIYAKFELIVYKISTVGGYHGYTTTSPSGQAQSGQEVIVYANPYSGYEFVEGTFSYQINSVGDSIPISYINGEYRFIMPEGDVLIYADYVPIGSNSYDISYSTINNGWLYTNPSNDIAYGTNVQVSVSPRYGYKLKEGSLCYKIEGQGTSYIIENTNGTYNFAMPKGNIVIYAEFEIEEGFYSINFAEIITNGTIYSYDDVAMPGSTVSLTVTPATGYKLIEGSLYYKINGEGISYPINYDPNYSSYCFTMPEGNVEIYAEFEQMGFIISTYATGMGTVTTLPANDANSQELVEVIVQPYNGYRLVPGSLYYMIDGDYSTTYPIVDNKFFMPNSNITIYAQFESAPYNITIDSLGNGTIVSDKLTAYSNEMVTLTITPNQGYKLKDNIIKINGVDNYSYSNTYSFYMYNNDVVITAEFVEHDILPEDKFNVNEKSWNIRPSISPMLSNEIYSLDQGTLYVTTVIKDLNGNVVLENIGTDIDNVSGYNLYKTSPIDAGKYTVEIIYGDYAKSLSIGVTNIEFGDFIDANYNISNYYSNFTTDTRSFLVDFWIDGLFSDLENLNLKLIESETGNVVAEAVDKNYVYYDEKDNKSVDLTGNNLESTNMKFDFVLDSALDTEKTYSIYAVYNKEIIFGYAAEISVTSNPLILDGNISGNTITFTTECLPAGTYVANYHNIFDYNLVVDENGIGTIDMSSNPISENYANFNVNVGETVVNARAQNYEIEDKYVENIVIHNSANYYYYDAATNQYVQMLLPLTDSVLFTLNNVNEGIVSLDAYQDGNYRVVDEMEVSELVGGEGSFVYNFDTKVVYRINVSGSGSVTFKVTDRPVLSTATYQVQGYYGNFLVIPYEGSVNIDDLSKIKFIYGAATGDIEFPIISYNSSEIKLDMSNAPAGIFKIRAIYPNYADGYDYDVDFSKSLSAYKVGDDSPNITALMAEGYKYYAEGVNFDKLTNAFIEIYRPVNGYLEFVKQANILITSNTRLDVPESATADLPDGTYVLYYLLDGKDKAAQIVEFTPNLSLYNVTFNSNGGSNVVGLSNVLEGTTIKMPSTPTKSGYKFIGWFKDAELTEQWNFTSDTVNQDITLYAKWEVAYTVKFHSMGGNRINDYKDIQPSSLIDEPGMPFREGFAFVGWYKDFELTNPWNFQQDIVTQNVTLYAKWDAISYIIAVSPTIGDRVSVQTSAKAGDIVQVTVTKDENSELQSIYWTGIPIDQKNSIDTNKLSFVMPAQNIEIGAFFSEMHALTVNVSKAESPYWIYIYGQESGYYEDIELPAGTTQHTLSVPSDNYDIYIYMGVNENWYYSHQTKSIIDNIGVEFIIPTTYSISGKVVCTNGALDNAYVYAYSNNDYRNGYINSDGTYSIAGLLPGEYTVTIEDWSNKYIGELNKTVVIDAYNAADINFSVAKGADLRVGLSKTEGTPAFKSYVYLYKFNGFDWEYVSNAVGSGIGELGFSGAINSVGSYKIALEYLENKNYTSPKFVSEPVEFTVTEEDIAAGTIAKSLTYSDPIDASAALSGDGNIVVTNVKTARTGDFVSLEVRYKNNGNMVINPEFYINLPAGVTMTENNVFGTSLNPNTNGVYKAVLYVGNVNSDIVSVDVDVKLDNQTFDFGSADISITKVTLNAPMNVKANESFKAYGEAIEGSKVMVKDAVTGQVLKTVTTQGKFYTADIILPEGTTKLVAVVLLTDNTTVQSKPVEVVAKSEPIAIENVYKNNYGVGLNLRLGVHTFSEYVNMNLMGFDFTLRTEFANSSNISKVVYHFSGLDFTANNNFEATISGWGGAGIKPITATVTTTGGEELIFTIAEVTILIDPSGIVKNSITGEPLAGAEVTCWIRNDYGIWEKWDAENYGQSNPQITGADGKYGWMVPEGVYRITATKHGFKDYDTMSDPNFSTGIESTIIIPPPRDDVNFSMIPEQYNISVGALTGGSISIQQTAAYTDYVTVTATPDIGKKLKNILVNGIAIEGFRFEMPDKDVVVTAEFVQDSYEVTGVIENFVIELDGQMVLVKLGDLDGYAIAYSTQNKLYQYLKGSNNVPLVYGMKSGNKYMLVGSSKGYALNYSLHLTTIEAMHNTDVIPDSIVKTIKVFEGFDSLGNAILKPLQ